MAMRLEVFREEMHTYRCDGRPLLGFSSMFLDNITGYFFSKEPSDTPVLWSGRL